MYSLIPVVCAQDITALVRALPGSVAQGLIWGIMAIGVFLTFKILDFADLTVDGTMVFHKSEYLRGKSKSGSKCRYV